MALVAPLFRCTCRPQVLFQREPGPAAPQVSRRAVADLADTFCAAGLLDLLPYAIRAAVEVDRVVTTARAQ